MSEELARREARAQHGIIEFAEEMQIIREENLYPNAGETHGGKLEPWETYCKEQWAMSSRTVNRTIQALPVLKRFGSSHAVAQANVSMAAAASVASLPEPVQDAILTESPRRNDASDKAKAARKVQRKAEFEGREASVEELIEATKTVKPKKAKKRKKRGSKFIGSVETAYLHIKDAASFKEPLSDVENDFAWDRMERIEYEVSRVRERLYRPEVARDMNEEFAEILEAQS